MTISTINLRYTDMGQGLPLVFLHGFPLSRGVWKKQIESLRSSYRIIAPDLRGLGDSETQPGPTTMGQCAADLRVTKRGAKLARPTWVQCALIAMR
jgi:pimeloyl-ACP methyl ester carboxylesterase